VGLVAAGLFYFFPCNIASFNAYPYEINLGESSMLSWKVEGANGVEIDQGVGSVPNEGLWKISPLESTVYTISAKNIFGCKQKQIKVTVIPSKPVINYFYADPESINELDSSKLNWDVSDAKSISIDHEIGVVSATGKKNVQPRASTTYTLTAINDAGSTDKQVKIEVSSLQPISKPVINYFYADPESINELDSSKLNWDVSDAKRVSIDHGIGGVNTTGQKNIQPRTTTTYTLTASNDGGSTDKQVKIEVYTEVNPSASDLIKQGDACRYMEKYECAEKAYRGAIELDPTNAQAWTDLSFVLNRQGDSDQALLAANNAIDFDPSYESAWNTKGNALAKLERLDEAIQAYDRAIELNSTYSNAWYNKGRILCKQTKYNESIQAYNEAIRIDPQFARAYYDKSIALKLVGLTAEADANYAKAKELGYTG
jgi:Flp pilus assembly protein TadD